jgi:hypothetical protein
MIPKSIDSRLASMEHARGTQKMPLILLRDETDDARVAEEIERAKAKGRDVAVVSWDEGGSGLVLEDCIHASGLPVSLVAKLMVLEMARMKEEADQVVGRISGDAG